MEKQVTTQTRSLDYVITVSFIPKSFIPCFLLLNNCFYHFYFFIFIVFIIFLNKQAFDLNKITVMS